MAKTIWARLRESTAAASAPALLRSQTDSPTDVDNDGDSEIDTSGSGDNDDDDMKCPNCSGEGIKAGDICTTCWGSGSVMKESSSTMCSICLSSECDIPDVLRVREAVLTAKARKAIPKDKFVFPDKAPASGSYPIHDRAHALAALSYSSGKPDESAVKSAVYKAYPDLKKTKESDTTLLDRIEALETQQQIIKSIREAKPASMRATFSTPSRVKTSGGQEGYQVDLIREGKGNSEDDQWYTSDAIKEMCESGVCEGMQAFADHPTESEEEERPERSVKELVGSYHDVRFAESSAKGRAEGIFVPLTLDESHPRYGWVITLAEAASRSTAPQPICGISLFGLSAGEDGTRPDGSFGRIVSMVRPSSADIVTTAGAGGGFIRQLMESARALRNRSRKEHTPMELMAYQSAVREATKRVREATSDEARNEAIGELTKLEEASIDTTPDSVEALAAAAPELVTKLREAATVESGKTIEDLQKQLRDAQGTISSFSEAVGISQAIREAGVSDPIEVQYYAGMAQSRGLNETVQIKAMVEVDKKYKEAERAATIAAVKESLGDILEDSEVEGAGARIPTSALPTDGGIEAMREAGIPLMTADAA